MVANTKVTAAFRKLVALVARAFYAGECPPKTAEEAAASMTGRAKLQGTTHGLAIILLDTLCGKDKQDKPTEWIKEEELAESVNLPIKTVRKTLRFLEQEQLLAREHRAESARSRKKQAAAEAASGRSTVTGDIVTGDAEGFKADVVSWCCLDYPSLINVLLLRLFKMRRKLQDQATDRHTIQKYLCQKCQRTYTSLDIATFPMLDLGFLCERCNEEGYDIPLRESYEQQDGELVDARERTQRVADAKQMQKAFEEQMKPLTEQIEKLTGIPIPDFGPLDDWTALRNVETARRERRAAGGSGHIQRREGELDGIDQDFDDTQVEVKLQGDTGTTEEASGAGPQKALPPWMLRQGITSTSNASGGTQMGAVLLQAAAAATGSSAGLSTSSEVVASEEDQKRIEEEYLRQYMAQVAAIQQRQAAARAGTLDAQGQQDLTDLKTDLAIAKAEVDETEIAAPAKRIKLDGGWSTAPETALPLGVKAENGLHVADEVHAMPSMQQTGVDDNDDSNVWEDVEVKADMLDIKPDNHIQHPALVADDDEWENV